MGAATSWLKHTYIAHTHCRRSAEAEMFSLSTWWHHTQLTCRRLQCLIRQVGVVTPLPCVSENMWEQIQNHLYFRLSACKCPLNFKLSSNRVTPFVWSNEKQEIYFLFWQFSVRDKRTTGLWLHSLHSRQTWTIHTSLQKHAAKVCYLYMSSFWQSNTNYPVKLKRFHENVGM